MLYLNVQVNVLLKVGHSMQDTVCVSCNTDTMNTNTSTLTCLGYSGQHYVIRHEHFIIVHTAMDPLTFQYTNLLKVMYAYAADAYCCKADASPTHLSWCRTFITRSRSKALILILQAITPCTLVP